MRYPHLFGSDARIFSCLAELGVGLTHEPGFHQTFASLKRYAALHVCIDKEALSSGASDFSYTSKQQVEWKILLDWFVQVDIRGNLFGMLSAHPLSPLVSLHHLDSVDPIFPNMNRTQALEHLFEALHGVFLFRCLKAIYFSRSPSIAENFYTMEERHAVGNCGQTGAIKNLEQIRVLSQKLELNIEQMKATRRQCCSIFPPFNKSMVLSIRQCGVDELISMHL
ncbi:hypothetical protein CK203_058366 [Vitis vinifera]|uniref:Uncharacterized protein n=1 Tax=Vitis vinifera TaxID=29760 RepID=A0A438G8A4_VITVI|nr:hypothetical protein CK203_058366 [Vitis vinifera]